MREILHSERFVNQAPKAVYATLLDEGTCLCSWRTMYRVLAAADEVRERRAQLRHPAYTKPELLATGPNRVWSWDITKLRGPVKWTYYHLYVILDIFSRYVVGWMVAARESAPLAERLIEASPRTMAHRRVARRRGYCSRVAVRKALKGSSALGRICRPGRMNRSLSTAWRDSWPR